MIKVGLLTIEQKEMIFGMEFSEDSYFNPIEDNLGNWIISQEEIELTTIVDFLWVKDLPLIDYIIKVVDDYDEF